MSEHLVSVVLVSLCPCVFMPVCLCVLVSLCCVVCVLSLVSQFLCQTALSVLHCNTHIPTLQVVHAKLVFRSRYSKSGKGCGLIHVMTSYAQRAIPSGHIYIYIYSYKVVVHFCEFPVVTKSLHNGDGDKSAHACVKPAKPHGD